MPFTLPRLEPCQGFMCVMIAGSSDFGQDMGLPRKQSTSLPDIRGLLTPLLLNAPAPLFRFHATQPPISK